jgi:hypothetical protein
MKRAIFHHATNTCLWLGEDANSKAAMAFVTRILDFGSVEKLVRDDTTIAGWVAFATMLRNSAFSHLWLIQDIAFARNVTLHFGQSSIHYIDFAEAVAIFASFRAELSILFRRNRGNDKALTDRKIRIAERFINVSTSSLRITNLGKIRRLLSLEELVSMLSDLSCVHPSDRIFSVLAVASDGPPPFEKEPAIESFHSLQEEGTLRIDYTKRTLDVYQDFVIHAIERSKSLDIICRHWARSSDMAVASLPTWVRALQYSFLQTSSDSSISELAAAENLVGLPGHSYYNASRGTIATFRTGLQSSDAGKSLFVRGCRIDTIAKLAPRASEGIIFYEWLELGGCLPVNDTKPPSENFWRTLVADRGPDGSNVPLWYVRAFVQCLHNLTLTGDINTNRLIFQWEEETSLVVAFLRRVQSVIWNRKFLVTKTNDWIGLAPTNAHVEDIICILYGCSVPVLLRAVDGGRYFHLVGEIYLHGMMNGEALAGRFMEEEFEIR